jgi:PAS domain S-box-containing protein
VWVAGQDGVIRFANPSAVAALGYDDVSDLVGKPSHQTIHYKRPDGSHFPAEECPLLLPRTTGETIHRADDWFVRRDGSMFPVEYWSAPIDGPDGRGAVVAFRDVSERRETEGVLRERDAILSALGQPVYVGTPDGLITYANPAAAEVLGYRDASELIGQNGHWLFHFKHPDGSHYPIEECPLARGRDTGNLVRLEEDWLVRKDGSMMPVACTAVPFEAPGGYGIAVSFTDLSIRMAAERAGRERDITERQRAEEDLLTARQRLKVVADEQAALRRVATLVARGAPQEEVFAVVAREVASVLALPLVSVTRFESGGIAVAVGVWGLQTPYPVGTSWQMDEHGASGQVHHTGRSARADYAHVPGPIVATLAREVGIRSAVAVPIVVSNRTWGAMMALSTVPQPADTEARLASFTELVATAIANAEARRELQRLAEEQAALRHVATLVARGAEPAVVFDAVCEVTGRLVGATSVNLAQFTPDEMNLTQAGWSERGTHIPPGTCLPLDGESINALIRQTRAPARVDSYEGRSGRLAARLRELGIRSEVGAPVVVDGEMWGALIAGTDRAEPLPPGTEERVASFAELIGTAVSNATARSELIASRARMVTASDVARRRVTRDLHDGAQQQLVSTIINLQLAQQAWSSAPERAREYLDLALRDAGSSISGLREIAAGIHPAILTLRGLSAALEALADRLPLPVRLDVTDRRLPELIEASIYFFCSEALTNVVKHAQASSAWVRVTVEEDRCAIEVGDDGIGGAEAGPETSGLIGLHDRMGALKGALHISSPASAGTTLRAWLPLPRTLVASEAEGSV